MGRGPESQATKIAKAMALVAQHTGVSIETLKPLIDESEEDKILEAQAVCDYFEKAKGFKHIECRNCGEFFAYTWYYDGVKFCGTVCMSRWLKKQGMTWDPTKDPDRRWGLTRPAVVPSQVISLLRDLALTHTPEDPLSDKPDEESS